MLNSGAHSVRQPHHLKRRLAVTNYTASSPLDYQFYYGALFSIALAQTTIPSSWAIIGGTTLLDAIVTPDFTLLSPEY